MKFGETPLDEAVGAILVHSVKFEKGRFKKGRVLSLDDVAALKEAGRTHVIAARLEAEDVGEDKAAVQIAEAASGEGTSASAAFTGRCNLFVETPGLLIVDEARIDALNLVDESMTIATLAPFALVSSRDMIATVKVIPFAVPAAVIARCKAIAADGAPLVRVARLKPLRAGLILTAAPGMKERILTKTVLVTRDRIENLGGTLAEEHVIRCAHNEGEVSQAIEASLGEGAEIVLVSGASAIVDRRDIIPVAIEQAGGEVDHFGMPVDPGNLLLIAHHGRVPVLGLPGCARSPALNGYDWVLRRLFAGLEIGPKDVMRMGAGGLLKEISSRPLPRAAAVAGENEGAAPRPAQAPSIAALVLAAGSSRRTGKLNKLLAELDGTPMVGRVADATLASRARPIVVVTGYEATRVRMSLGDRDVIVVENPDYAEGLSTSLRRGLGALPSDVDGVIVCLGDMPAVTSRHLDKLIAAYDPEERRAICVPTFGGKRGNPVLWDRNYFDEMAGIAGDVGARHLIGQHAEAVCEVAMDDEGVLLDLDTPEALSAYSGGR